MWWTDRPTMTIAVDLGRKATKQTNKTQLKKSYLLGCDEISVLWNINILIFKFHK